MGRLGVEEIGKEEPGKDGNGQEKKFFPQVLFTQKKRIGKNDEQKKMGIGITVCVKKCRNKESGKA